jgi:protein SCO1
MSKKAKFLTLFFIILTIVFVYVLSLISDGDLLRKRFKTISTVQPFSFTNQNGQIITQKNLEGKVVLVEFFFTTCQTICPIMNKKVKSIYDLYKNEPDFLIVSHTSDPKNDQVAQLKRYADSIGADGKNWWFLTGRKDSLYYAARKSYALDDQHSTVNDPESDFIHTQLLALVNKNGEIKKKVYDSDKKEEMEELKEDIKKALAE